MNNFEIGLTDKKKLASETGNSYFKKHIQSSENNRLQKYRKDASGKSGTMSKYIPLSEIEKPSLSGRVKLYMQKLEEEANEDKRDLKSRSDKRSNHAR